MSDNRTIPSSVTGASVALFVFLLLIAFLVWALRGPTDRNATHALIMAQEATILGPLVQHNVPTATVLLKNTGHSPARTVKTRLVMTVWTSTTFPDWEMPLQLTNDVRDLGNIAPGSSVSQTVPLVAPLSDVQGMHLERKNWLIVLLGVIDYTDVTHTKHTTTLCLIWRDTTDEKMSPCEKWNDLT